MPTNKQGANDPLGKNDTWKFYKDKKDEFRWRRTASNGEIVGTSHEGYKNRKDCLANAQRAGYEKS